MDLAEAVIIGDHEVLAVIEKRLYRNRFDEYLVVWKNGGKNSWEPVSYVPNDVLQKFKDLKNKKEFGEFVNENQNDDDEFENMNCENEQNTKSWIVDSRIVDGRFQYLVKTESWEEEKNIDPERIRTYYEKERVAAEKRKRKSEETENKLLASP